MPVTDPAKLPRSVRATLEAECQSGEMELADSIHTISGWRIAAPDFYTCIIPPHMALDQATLRRIHEFDPGLIPLVRKQKFFPPNSTEPVTVCHWALGRHVKNPRNKRVGFYVEMPSNAKHPQPNMLEAILEERDKTVLQEGGPGAYQTFGPWLYHVLRRAFLNHNPRKWIRDQQKAREEREAREKRARMAELAYLQKGMDRLHVRAAELGLADWQRYWAKREAIKKGKPRVFLGGY